jgi:hypothetical protein
MLFGLKNPPASFQRLMNAIFCGLGFERCRVYQNDVCNLRITFNEALENLFFVFTRLRHAYLK